MPQAVETVLAPSHTPNPVLPLPSLFSDVLHEAYLPLRGARRVVEELRVALQSGALTVSPALRAGQNSSAARPFADHAFPDETVVRFREATETAASSIESAGRLLEDFLTIAEIEDGGIILEPDNVTEFDGWLRGCASEFAPSLLTKRLELELCIEPGLPLHVVIDSHRLRQVLTHYVMNAIQRAPFESTITVHIRSTHRTARIDDDDATTLVMPTPSSVLSVAPTPPAARGAVVWEECPEQEGSAQDGMSHSLSRWQPKPYSRGLTGSAGAPDRQLGAPDRQLGAPVRQFLLVLVCDAGPAVSADDAPLLFLPFVQRYADGAQRRLDLAVSKGIVRMMGGAVGVASSPNLSTANAIFWFDVPLRVSASSLGDAHTTSSRGDAHTAFDATVAPPSSETHSGRSTDASAAAASAASGGSSERRAGQGRLPGAVSTDIGAPFLTSDTPLVRAPQREQLSVTASDLTPSHDRFEPVGPPRRISGVSTVSVSVDGIERSNDVDGLARLAEGVPHAPPTSMAVVPVRMTATPVQPQEPTPVAASSSAAGSVLPHPLPVRFGGSCEGSLPIPVPLPLPAVEGSGTGLGASAGFHGVVGGSSRGWLRPKGQMEV
jgi:signal transduction histidine kinase